MNSNSWDRKHTCCMYENIVLQKWLIMFEHVKCLWATPLSALLRWGQSLAFIRRVYFPGFFQWGPPTFNAGEALAMIAASFVSFFEVVTLPLDSFKLEKSFNVHLVQTICLPWNFKLCSILVHAMLQQDMEVPHQCHHLLSAVELVGW